MSNFSTTKLITTILQTTVGSLFLCDSGWLPCSTLKVISLLTTYSSSEHASLGISNNKLLQCEFIYIHIQALSQRKTSMRKASRPSRGARAIRMHANLCKLQKFYLMFGLRASATLFTWLVERRRARKEYMYMVSQCGCDVGDRRRSSRFVALGFNTEFRNIRFSKQFINILHIIQYCKF